MFTLIVIINHGWNANDSPASCLCLPSKTTRVKFTGVSTVPAQTLPLCQKLHVCVNESHPSAGEACLTVWFLLGAVWFTLSFGLSRSFSLKFGASPLPLPILSVN